MSRREIMVSSVLVGCVALMGVLALWGRNASSNEKTPLLKGPVTAIVDATIYTMEAGEKPFQGVVLLQGDRIRAVGEHLAIPQGAVVINARGKVVTPGLAVAGTRVGLVEIDLEHSTSNAASRTPSDIRAAFRAVDGFNARSSLIPIVRIEGITSVMVQPFGGLIAGQSMLVDLDGDDSQMLVHETLALHASISSGRSADSWMRLGQVLEQARFFLNHQVEYDAGRARRLGLTRIQLLALGRVVQRQIPLVLDVHRASDILAAIRFAREQQIRLVMAGVSEGWMVAKTLSRSYIPVILYPPNNLPVGFDRLGSRYDNAALLQKAGVLFALGSRGGAHNIRALRHEAGIAVAWGLPHIEALRSLTYNFYEIFNITRDYGTLEKGKIANVVIWSGDPLELSTRAERVWIQGRSIPMISRQTLLRDRYKQLKDIYQQQAPIRRQAPTSRPVAPAVPE